MSKSIGRRLVVRVVILGAIATATACARPTAPGALRLTTAAAGPDTRLTLHPAPHLKISARLPPALELADGTLIRFTTDRLTPDSAYFAVPPSATVTGRRARVHGRLRASVCRDDEQVCRSLTIEL